MNTQTEREKRLKATARLDARSTLETFAKRNRGVEEFDGVILAIDNYFHKDA